MTVSKENKIKGWHKTWNLPFSMSEKGGGSDSNAPKSGSNSEGTESLRHKRGSSSSLGKGKGRKKRGLSAPKGLMDISSIGSGGFDDSVDSGSENMDSCELLTFKLKEKTRGLMKNPSLGSFSLNVCSLPLTSRVAATFDKTNVDIRDLKTQQSIATLRVHICARKKGEKLGTEV